jgi:hypothetical protein
VYWIRGWISGVVELFSDGVDALAQKEPDPDVLAGRATIKAHQELFLSWVGLADVGYKLIIESIEIPE